MRSSISHALLPHPATAHSGVHIEMRVLAYYADVSWRHLINSDQVFEACQHAIDLASNIDDPNVELQARNYASIALSRVGDIQAATNHTQVAEAQLEPFLGAGGQPTALHDTVFTTIPGSPAYVGKATSFKPNNPALGHNVNIQGHNAVQGSFRFEG